MQPTEAAVIRTASPVTWFNLAKTTPLAATISQDHKLRIVSLPDGAERRVIDLTGRDVDVFALSPDGQTVAIGDHHGVVSICATDTGALRHELRLAHYPGLAVFSHNGALLAISAQGDPIQLIDVASGRATAGLGNPIGGTNALAFSRDDRLVATGDGDAVVRVYEVKGGRRVAENRELRMIPLAVEFSADGATVIAGGGDKVLLFVDAKTGQSRRSDKTGQPAAALEVSPDGQTCAVVFMHAEDMTKPDRIQVMPMQAGSAPALVDWIPPRLPAGGGWTSDGQLLVALASPEALHLWRLR
jgi:WD40 repeat protein